MCRYCKLFLRSRNWSVQHIDRPAATGTELIISKPSHQLDVQFLIEKDHFSRIPDHFLNRLALRAERSKRPLLLVTDFDLGPDLTSRCRQRKVYPIYYKGLGDLEKLVPSTREFRQL